MKDSGCGGQFCLMTMLLSAVLFGTLALPAQSARPLLPEAKKTVATAVRSVNESKLHLIFCVSGHCDYWGGWKECHCCGDVERKENCYHTMDECREKCPNCHPTCPLRLHIQSAMEGLAVQALRNGTLHK
ncbi:hypothetical protein EJB05_21954 [Eragrostis curvula]|uniref:Embryo surrounding factor 1 brassicaceae domain-containing protein n=1 Tax=Eragrostis curvula TaxID=38414 RepID=A0A5J9V2H8_9POAL|nr:hypothetical protein EJB05_21954 [Eragrostis curvula]